MNINLMRSGSQHVSQNTRWIIANTKGSETEELCRKMHFFTHILKVPCVFYPPPIVITYSFVC